MADPFAMFREDLTDNITEGKLSLRDANEF